MALQSKNTPGTATKSYQQTTAVYIEWSARLLLLYNSGVAGYMSKTTCKQLTTPPATVKPNRLALSNTLLGCAHIITFCGAYLYALLILQRHWSAYLLCYTSASALWYNCGCNMHTSCNSCKCKVIIGLQCTSTKGYFCTAISQQPKRNLKYNLVVSFVSTT